MSLYAFIVESNAIERIEREPTQHEIDCHSTFLACSTVRVPDMEAFVADIAGAKLRDQPGMDARVVGGHIPPRGGPHIRSDLEGLLKSIERGSVDPYTAHVRYETLHPMTDGNGRSGRALWAWQMKQEGRDPFALGFLHRWYYESLGHSR